MSKGYYSLIQFCPDFARAEAANVGVVVFDPDTHQCSVRLGTELRNADRLARSSTLDMNDVRDAAAAMARRFEESGFESVEDMERFARSRGNQIVLTTPRPMRLDDLEAQATRLATELVEAPQATEVQRRPAIPIKVLDEVFQDLRGRAPDRVLVRPRITVPALPEPVQVDFGYRNGRLNLVSVKRLPPSRSRATEDAMMLSKLGELLEQAERRRC